MTDSPCLPQGDSKAVIIILVQLILLLFWRIIIPVIGAVEKTLNTDEPGKGRVHHLQGPLLTVINILGCIQSEMGFPHICLVCKLGLLLCVGFWGFFPYSSLIYFIHCSSFFSLPSPSPPTSLPPLEASPSPPPQKRAGLPGTSTKYGITSYSKTRHTFSHQGWTRPPSRRNRVPKAGRVKDSPCSYC